MINFKNLDPAVRRMLIIPRGMVLRAPPAPRRQPSRPQRRLIREITSGARRIRPRRFVKRRALGALEMKHLEAIPEKHGISKGIFDMHAHLDNTLTYHEAKTEITRKVREVSRIRAPVITERSFIGDLERHLDNLKFQASAGSRKAVIELEHWNKHRRRL